MSVLVGYKVGLTVKVIEGVGLTIVDVYEGNNVGIGDLLVGVAGVIVLVSCITGGFLPQQVNANPTSIKPKIKRYI